MNLHISMYAKAVYASVNSYWAALKSGLAKIYGKCNYEYYGLCSICIEAISLDERLCVLPCMHFFHHQCLSQWVEYKMICPLCRTLLKTRHISSEQYVSIAPLYIMDKTTNKMYRNEKRLKALKAGPKARPPIGIYSARVKNMKQEQRWTAKISRNFGALLKRKKNQNDT